ncbi:translation initiation factor IF-2, partial [Adlercreutzia mucosicola]
AVEEALRRGHKKPAKATVSAPEAPKAAPAPVAARPKANFDSLLSQIEAEKQRMEAQKSAEAEARRSGGRAGGKKGKKGTGHQVVPELEVQQAAPEDRYAQMAVQAEKLQRDKVLAEARAAVAAATTHEGEGRRKKRKEKREAEARERAEAEAIERGLDPSLVLDDSVVEIPQGATVAKFAELLGVQPNDVIKRLFMLGQVLTLTQSMNDETMELIADDMGRKVRVVSPEEEYAVVYNDSEADLKPRPPVVTVMGHVDHGKTSLLDAIRDTGVVASEAGGITQHIGASVVNIGDRQITFIDTPGHEAFTAMRARGAQVTDVIVLVVAADDGVMPQTIEAINHAKAAEVPIVVAVNKIDKPGANPDRVRQELTEYGVIPEEWGGSNMFVEVSAKKKLHIDDLLETIILQADVLELKANPDAEASGFVIEANLDKGRGPVATVLIQRGTLHTGDVVVAGTSYGRVRALVNPRGEHVAEARPADPVEILGLNSVPTAGDEFRVFEDERDARKLAEERALRARLAAQETKSHMSLDDLFSRIEEGKQTDLNLIVKADVQGSIEALRDAFDKMDQSEVRINIVHSAVGGITETDVTLAAASDAIIIGFNVRPTGKSRVQAEKEKVDIRLYRVIYQAIEDINAARVGLLSPDIVEVDTGIAEVRETFKVPKVGTIAGCYIIEGEINRDDKVRIVRDGTVIFEGHMASLRRFKDDVKSVKQGYECGIGIEKFQDLKVGDTIEGYQVKEVERTE